MLISLILFIVGLVFVLKGGDLFVDSSVSIATRLNIPRVVIGGTIVSLATTSPELVVSSTASYMGDSGIALGNAMGSAIANIGLIISLSAIIAPIAIDVVDFRRRAIWMLLSAILVLIFAWDFEVARKSGIILTAFASMYLLLSTLRAFLERPKTEAPQESSTPEHELSWMKIIGMFLLGAVLVIVGGKILVNAAVAIAKALHIPSLIIGLTAVAVGTSLPELVTAVKSAKKNVADLAIGNIVGANILNLAFITGISAIINPLTLDAFTRNYAFSWLFIMIIGMIIILWRKGMMSKTGGYIMLTLYLLYNLGLVYYSAV